MSKAVVIVTGANRGIGLAIVQQIAKNPPVKPILILACARNPPDNSQADNNDRADAQVEIQWHKLDLANKDSITNFAHSVQQQHGAMVDVLINNGGVNLEVDKPYSVDTATQTINVNYHGTAAMTRAFLPLMRRPALPSLGSSRIVNISSVASKLAGALPDTSPQHQKFRTAKSLQDLDALADSYLTSVAHGTESQDGWLQGKSYHVSKALINALTRVLAHEHKDLIINTCCPGWCKTDMGDLVGRAGKSAEDGAKIPLRLAFADLGGKSGGRYWENDSVMSRGDGHVAEWM